MSGGISVEQSRLLGKAVVDLAEQTEASGVFLIDYSGNVIAEKSDHSGDIIQAIAALSAGSFSATRELASIVGEEAFHSVFHQGRNASIYIHSIGAAFLLLVVFDKATTEGLVKLYVERMSGEMEPTLQTVGSQSIAAAGGAGQAFELGPSDTVFGN